MASCPQCGSSLSGASDRCANCGSLATGSLATGGAVPAGAMAAQDFAPLPLPVGPYHVPFGATELLSSAFRMWQRDWGRLVVLALFPTGAMFALALLGGIGAVASGITGVDTPSTALLAGLIG